MSVPPSEIPVDPLLNVVIVWKLRPEIPFTALEMPAHAPWAVLAVGIGVGCGVGDGVGLGVGDGVGEGVGEGVGASWARAARTTAWNWASEF
jgi:hypothetical protein